MTSDYHQRLGGLACILCGLLLPVSWIVIDIAGEPRSTLTNTLDFVAFTLLIFALVSIYGVQVKESGYSGFLGFLLTIVAVAIALSVNWLPEGEELGGTVDSLMLTMAISGLIGYLLLAIGSRKASVFPTWTALLWPAGWIISVIGFTVTISAADLQVEYDVYLNILGILVWAVGIIAAGAKLAAGVPEPAAEPQFG